jgi:catechol 2,3-dioxygenase-like lactoylglutathione lyase family enzyme
MKIKSVSGITCFVKDLGKTARFYEALGFETRTREPDHVTVYSNWFWIDFLAMDKGGRPGFKKPETPGNKGAGMFVCMSVDDVDAFHKALLSKGLKPAGEPQDRPWGNREFIIRDPDGYNLVVFKRK